MDCQITMKVDNWIEILESSYFQRLRMFIWEISAITITIMIESKTIPSLRQRLREGETIIGSWINSGSPIIAEIMATCGFDFLCVDVEHSAVDLPQTQQLFQAIRSGRQDCAAMVRLHGVDYAFAKRYLDAGANGVVAPMVRTREEAMLLVQATKYPPQGLRGVGFAGQTLTACAWLTNARGPTMKFYLWCRSSISRRCAISKPSLACRASMPPSSAPTTSPPRWGSPGSSTTRTTSLHAMPSLAHARGTT